MKRLLAAGCALGFTGAGLVAFATPGSAGDPPEEPAVPEPEFVLLESAVTPADPKVGDDFTISPIDTCTVADPEAPGELGIYVAGDNGTADNFDDDTELYDVLPLDADGSWAGITLTGDVAENVYFEGVCLPPGWEELFDECFGDPAANGGAEAETLAAATTDDDTETTESTTTTLPEEPPVDCTIEYYVLEFAVGDAPAPGPRPVKPIPGVPPLTG